MKNHEKPGKFLLPHGVPSEMRANRSQEDAATLITVAAVDGGWKITELELLEEKRFSPTTPATTKAG